MITEKQHIRCALIGKKLSHSFSPEIHRHLADYSYSLVELEENEIEGFLKGCDFDALNVTIPYKKTVLPYLDALSDEAKRIGAVNTVIKDKNGALIGDNTDYYGFLHTVKSSGIEAYGKKVLILGTGGASLTAKAVLHDLGAKEIVFVSRSGEINYENVYSRCADAEVIVNCTPVGMFPNNGASPISLEGFTTCTGIIDMIYNPAKTALLLDAERLGIKHINGLSMLVAQAKRACELFLGEKIDDGEINKIKSIIEEKQSNIILVGMPGCGKTTVGKRLSEATGRAFVDTDRVIREKYGSSPAEMIKCEGEAKFRAVESEIIAEYGKMSGIIIATGGGAVTRHKNKAPLRQNGNVVFINRPIGMLDTSDRPLSKDIESLYEKRLPMYRDFCDFEVENGDSAETCAKNILERLKK